VATARTIVKASTTSTRDAKKAALRAPIPCFPAPI
jgi:hypothetical protein